MDARRRVLLVDAYSLFYRAHHALPPMETRAGEPTSGLYGLSAVLLKLLREERPRGAAVALDSPRPTFRHEAFAGYKATRARMPSPLVRQLGALRRLIEAWGFPAFEAPGFEADDILATLAVEVPSAGEPVLVVTGDRDCLQLARAPVDVLMVSRGPTEAKRYDEDAVIRRFGVSPRQLPELQALVGDPSDDLPGVPGIGLRTAAKLLAQFGSLEALLARLSEAHPARAREAIAAHAEPLRTWARLATLRADVPLGDGPRFGAFTEEARARVRAMFEELEFGSLLPRLAAIAIEPSPA